MTQPLWYKHCNLLCSVFLSCLGCTPMRTIHTIVPCHVVLVDIPYQLILIAMTVCGVHWDKKEHYFWITANMDSLQVSRPYKGGSKGVSKVSRNWSDHLWLALACISLITMLPYSYNTFMRWKPVINVSRSALAHYASVEDDFQRIERLGSLLASHSASLRSYCKPVSQFKVSPVQSIPRGNRKSIKRQRTGDRS